MKKSIKALVAIILCFTCMLQPCTAFSATFTGKTYVKEVILSYGKTEGDAKSWLQNRGYKFIDENLNAGADDTWSTKRAVYLGYKTTSKVSEAITDMKVMNMKGGYSVQDYKMLLEQQKEDINKFVEQFLVSVNEFRENYKKGQQRALAAFEILNLMYEDDTEECLGDLLLNKVKEEYTDDEFNALSKEEQSKVADLTTILMQANGTSVLAMKQAIAIACDDTDKTWIDRYESAKTYDEMVEDLMDKDNLTVSQAVKQLAAEYDSDAKNIASKFEAYKEYFKYYTDEGISLSNTAEEVEAYQKEHSDFDFTSWSAIGTQYELVKALENDGVSLFDLITSDDYDAEGEDAYLLYPLVSTLTDGQRSCLDFLTMSQLVSMGINDDNSIKEAMKHINLDSEKYQASIYSGVDRSIFSEDVALTGDAYALQNSSDKNALDNWTDYISDSTKMLFVMTCVSSVATLASWALRAQSFYNYKQFTTKLSEFDMEETLSRSNSVLSDVADDVGDVVEEVAGNNANAGEVIENAGQAVQKVENLAGANNVMKAEFRSTEMVSADRAFQGFMKGASVIISCVTIGLMLATLWSAYKDMQKYYNAEFTPIPMHMVNQDVNENDEKVFTYYTAVKCNREEAQMVDDSNKLLEDYGDLNGDVGRQWVALYTTKDEAAGDPITADFTVQYNNSSVPSDDSLPLSKFCESTAQNLTNEKAGYTYADSKKGIYLFYNIDNNAFAGSAFSNGTYALIAGGSMIIVALISCGISKVIKKKKSKGGVANA